jgi:hypothetical protein
LRHPPNYEWASDLRDRFPGVFCIREHLSSQIAKDPDIHSGQFWFCFPIGSFIEIYSKADKLKWCPAVLKDGECHPVPEQPPGPLAMKLGITERPGQKPIKDPWHKRRGFLLGNPHTDSHRADREALFDYQRAIWIPGTSTECTLHGSIPIPDANNEKSYYKTWAAWSISSRTGLQDRPPESPKLELLRPVGGPSLAERPSLGGQGSLLPHATKLLAQMLGLQPWEGGRPRRSKEPWPERGELIAVRFGTEGGPLAPCLVVSPAEVNQRNDLLVLQCIPYRGAHERLSTVVPVPRHCTMGGHPWSIDLTLVRGIAFARQFWKPISPSIQVDFVTVQRRLRQLYA